MLELIRNLAIHLAVELDLHYEDDERRIADSLALLRKARAILREPPEEVQHVLNRFDAAEHEDPE